MIPEYHQQPRLHWRWFTVLARNNKALQDSGILSFAALKTKYSNTGNPLNLLDSLNDLWSTISFLMPNTWRILFLQVLISHWRRWKYWHPNWMMWKCWSMISILTACMNPVLNSNAAPAISPGTTGVPFALAHFTTQVRQPTAIYWDVADFPWVRKTCRPYSRRGQLQFAYGAMKVLHGTELPIPWIMRYTTSSTINVFWGDYLSCRWVCHPS